MKYGRITGLCLPPECAKSLYYAVKVKVRDALKISVGDYRVTVGTFVSGSCRI